MIKLNKIMNGHFKLNQVEAKVGDTINLELSISNDVEFLSSDFIVTYDTTKFKYISYEKGSIENFTVYANETTDGTIKIAGIQDSAQPRTINANTSIIVLEFDVIADRGTESVIQLQCESLYTSETQKSETTQTSGNVEILDISGLTGKIITNTNFNNAKVYLYEQNENTLVDQSDIDTNGVYNLEATSIGKYYIRIKKQGYLDYYIKGIEITQIDNLSKTVNDVELTPGDLNDDSEIELLDLVKLNDNIGTGTIEIDKQTILNNYTKKSTEVTIDDVGYKQ